MNEIEDSQSVDSLKDSLKSLTHLPGVYIMKNQSGDVLYIGKARDLKARVKTYFLEGGDGRFQIKFLMKKVKAIETIVCQSEDEALILERDLINKYKPRYNIRLKDDKSYLSIRIDVNSKYPKIDLVRRVFDDGAEYFGPYSSSFQIKELLEVLKKVVPLRTCSDPVFYNRQRPCLEYQIKRCCGPCCLPVDEMDYRAWVKQAVSILQGKTSQAIADLDKKMNEASEELRFEEAAALRDRVEVLRKFSNGERVVYSRGENRDIVGIYREGDVAVFTVLQFRNGRISETNNFTIKDINVDNQELIESSLYQYYEKGSEVPSEIILPFKFHEVELFRDCFSKNKTSKVELTIPERGSKLRLLELAEINARQHFITKFNAESRYILVAKKLARIAKLKNMPRKIECIDISNFQGSDIVGAVVVFFDGLPVKRAYRKYIISQQDKPDDFTSIYEVVHRRLSSAISTDSLPDLLLIDGGLGQLNAALRAREELGIDLDIISLAKIRVLKSKIQIKNKIVNTYNDQEVEHSRERLFIPGEEEPYALDDADELCHLLQRIRDEVHNFVISFHRTKRQVRVFKSALDDIPGIGIERRNRLIKHYGSIVGIKNRPIEEVAKVGRMSAIIAQNLLNYINNLKY